MNLLHDDLLAVNATLSGMAVKAKGESYNFDGFYLTTERLPPVAEGYVLHIRLGVGVSREEEVTTPCGGKTWIRKKYAFEPQEIAFTASRAIDGDGT